MRSAWFFLAVILVLGAPAARAETLKQVLGAPRSQRVYDYAGVLSREERGRLRSQLLSMEKRHVAQGAVIVLRRVEGRTIERFANGIGDRWGVGERGKDNGFVLVVALEQRKWRLQTGKGLRKRISDAAAAQLMRDAVVPNFRQKQYAEGLATALSAIDRKASGRAAAQVKEYSSPSATTYIPSTQYQTSSGDSGFGALFALFGVFALIVILASAGQAGGKSRGLRGFSCTHYHPHHHTDHSSTHASHHSGSHSSPHVDSSPPPSSGGGDYGGGSTSGGGGASGGW